jgi:phosphonate C-P lyase system protein PhnG
MDDVRPTGTSGASPAGPCVLKNALQRVLPAAATAEIEEHLDRLWTSGRFRVEIAPQAGLVMCSVVDSFDTPFHLGEVLVTRADVVFDGVHRGCGVVCGDAPEQALLLAAIEAVERGGGGALLEPLAGWVLRLEAAHAEHLGRESACAAATRVRFESMRPEKVDFGSLGG